MSMQRVEPESEHRAYVELGARWFKREGFPVVEMELNAAGSRERPDVIAFRSATSALIEVKCSRSDFHADRHKPERARGGLGVYRFYLCPAGLLTVDDVPAKWGLLWVENRRIRAIKRPTGNHWPAYDPSYSFGDWPQFMHEPDLDAERDVLYSIARRRSLSRSEECYEARLRQERSRADRLGRSNDRLREEVEGLRRQIYLLENGLQETSQPQQQLKAKRRKIRAPAAT